MRILSFDPGHQTGVALVDDSGQWLWGMTVDQAGLGVKDFFRGLTMIAKPDVVVIEEPPHFARDEVSTHAYHLIRHWFDVAGYPVVSVNPGQWKGMVARSKISGQHQMDAADIAQWYRRHRISATQKAIT